MTIATDHDLDTQTAVRDELEWTPEVDAAGIGVAVDNGTVTLSGQIDSYAERVAAKKAALRVRGVRALVDDLVVRTEGVTWPVSESEIAQEVEEALKRASNVPDTVQAEVQQHTVTLIGEVDWDFQRQAAQRAVQCLRGVHSISNMIRMRPRPSASDTQQRIIDALTRNAQLDAKGVHVSVVGNRVSLTGTVRSWAERRQAANAAWSSPHVTDVDNEITVTG